MYLQYYLSFICFFRIKLLPHLLPVKVLYTQEKPGNYGTSWWFQPLWKIWVKMDSSSPRFGVKIKNIKNVWNHHLPGDSSHDLFIPDTWRSPTTPWVRVTWTHHPKKVTIAELPPTKNPSSCLASWNLACSQTARDPFTWSELAFPT